MVEQTVLSCKFAKVLRSAELRITSVFFSTVSPRLLINNSDSYERFKIFKTYLFVCSMHEKIIAIQTALINSSDGENLIKHVQNH